MDANVYWDLFLRTGAPAAYLMYKEAKHLEAGDVPNCSGAGYTADRLQ